MKLTTAHSEVFGSLADNIEKNESSWKKVPIEIHNPTCVDLTVLFLRLVV